ncbi:MAG: hypothetical protein WC342_06740 [Methanoregula sp.]|jgi:DNA-binding transcriptional ArsR family regulator
MTTYKEFIHIIFLALCCLSFISCPGVASQGDYTVTFLPPGSNPGVPTDTVKVPVGEYTPRDIATILAISISQVLLFPAELLLMFKSYLYLGFRRIRRNNVLDNPSRDAIFHYIQSSPGTDFTEISKETGVTQNSLRYHLAVLRLMNKVTLLESSRNTRYYENSGSYSLLSDDGILVIRKEGRTARYEINREALPYLEKYLPLFDTSFDPEGTR